jgi:hypothetical protein
MLGSAPVPRAGERVLAIANFRFTIALSAAMADGKVRLGETPKPAPETRALPRRRPASLGQREDIEHSSFRRVLRKIFHRIHKS